MPHRDPTIRSRELGDGLRQAMEQAGLTGKQAAQMLSWSPSFVSLLLSGKRGASEVDIAAFLGVCRVKSPERDRLLALCREQDNPGWLQQHGSRMPKQLVTLIDHENKAVAISAFEVTGVPGLLQTGEYARAAISRIVNVPPDEVDDRVAARLARQSLFSRDRPARFTFYLHESALRLPVGGPAVMAEQLRHLQRMSTRSYLTLRVVPVALGAHAAMTGAFRLMEFAEFKPVAYLESETSSLFLEKPEEIQAYRRILGALADTALGEGQSRELIAALATGLYADGEDHYDRAWSRTASSGTRAATAGETVTASRSRPRRTGCWCATPRTPTAPPWPSLPQHGEPSSAPSPTDPEPAAGRTLRSRVLSGSPAHCWVSAKATKRSGPTGCSRSLAAGGGSATPSGPPSRS